MYRAFSIVVMGATVALSTGCLYQFDPYIDEIKVPGARIRTTAGDIVAQLDIDRAPETVTHFTTYATDGFYDGTVIHRIEPNAILHAGAWAVGLAAKETNEPIVNESDNGLGNTRGTVAMARTDDLDSATSQFFVNLKDNPDLDGGAEPSGYTVFGRVTSGMEVVDEIGALPTAERDGYTDVPRELVTIESVERLDVSGAVGAQPTVKVNTDLGSFVIELTPAGAPVTVENFLAYVDSGFYAGTVFHRVVADFVIQGGGIELRPVDKSEAASIPIESGNRLSNTRGTLAIMPKSDGSGVTTEFVVNLADNPQYDAPAGSSSRAVFGSVIEGLEILDQIAAGETTTRGELTEFPAEEIRIEYIEIFELPTGRAALTPEGEQLVAERQYDVLVALRNITVAALAAQFTN